MSSSKIELLNSKIRQFLKKFYLDKLYKGIILFVIVLLATFIAFSLFEYFSYSNTVVRSILFYSFIALAAGIGIAYILIPALKSAVSANNSRTRKLRLSLVSISIRLMTSC